MAIKNACTEKCLCDDFSFHEIHGETLWKHSLKNALHMILTELNKYGNASQKWTTTPPSSIKLAQHGCHFGIEFFLAGEDMQLDAFQFA